MEEQLLFIEQCLKKFEYPNIYGVKMAEIFCVSNRMFLLSWLYRLIHGSSMNEILPEECLFEFLNWFCKSSQVKGIIKADIKYPVQLKIFYRIFKSLDSIKREQYQNENHDNVTSHDTKNLYQRDINIFKNFGPIKICDDGDFHAVAEMAYFNHLTDENDESNEDAEFSSSLLESDKLYDMEKKVKSAIFIVSNILKNVDKGDFNVELNENDIEFFRILNEYIKKGKRYINNVEALSKFAEELNNYNLETPVGNKDESIKMAKEVIRLIHDINNM